MTTDAALAMGAAGVLAHSLVARAATDSGVRALSIKGGFAADFGLRDRRSSADADILIDPNNIERLCDQLGDRGWHTRAGRLPPTFIDLHSVTLINDRWPCDLDIHRYFPGFFAPPEVVFELLWEGRVVHRETGIEVLTPSRAGMAVVVALHAARTPYLDKSRRDLETVRDAVSLDFTRAETADFLAIVRGGRAQWVLEDLLTTLGLPATDDAAASEKQAWRRNQQRASDKSADLWIREVAEAPLFRKPGVLLEVLWVPREHIPRNDPNRLPTPREAWRYQRSRWVRGAKALLGFLRP